MKKGDTALLQVSRVSTMEDDEMQWEVVGEDGESIRLAMTLLDYARVITGEAHVPVKVARYGKGENDESG